MARRRQNTPAAAPENLTDESESTGKMSPSYFVRIMRATAAT